MLEQKLKEGPHRTKPQSRTAQEWRRHWQSWKETTLTKAHYCREHGLCKDSFYYWCRRLSKLENPSTPSDFVPIVPISKDSSSSEITVEILISHQMRLSITLSEHKLIDLIQELSHATPIIR